MLKIIYNYATMNPKEVVAMLTDFSELSRQYFTVSDIFVSKQFSKEKTSIDMCAGPRSTDALLLFISGTAVCHQENHEPCFVSQGTVMYMPKGSRYAWDILPAANGLQQRILFEFNLKRVDIARCQTVKKAITTIPTGERLCFSDHVVVASCNNTANYQNLFEKLHRQFADPDQQPLEIYLTIHEIFAQIGMERKSERRRADFKAIEKGISYLETTEQFDLQVSDLAKMCSVSLRYFEKLFKAYAGVSPKEYLDARRISLIKILLGKNELSLEQIATGLSFCDVGHLCRFFKQKTGLTPTQYKQI